MKPGHSLMKHYLQFKDLRAEEYAYLFDRARIIKTRFKNYERYQPLVDRTLAMIFEKASTRTRVSFEAGMYQMGGSVVHLTTGDSQLGRAEPVEDSARVISRMVDIVMIRTFEQAKLERFAAHSRVPVINGLTNEYHPCQILADIFTFIEHRGTIHGKVVAWVGDGNNMANTWLQAAEILGFTVHVSTPSGYEVDPAVAGIRDSGCYKVFNHPMQACEGAAPGDHRRLDQHGLRGRERRAPQGLRRLVRRRRDDGRGAARRAVHALPAGAPRRGGHRRGHRRAAERGLGRGREPHARAEGADGVPAARAHRLRRGLPRNCGTPARGVDPSGAAADHAGMDAKTTPPALPPEALQLQRWADLREELQKLHADLEYLRLLLRMRGRSRACSRSADQ